PFWRQDLTGFHKFRHLRLNLPLVTCFERQISGKNLSGLVIPGNAGGPSNRATGPFAPCQQM
ncbi:MAG: hypothetical protein KAX26_06955, partial [Anaerolineae bacterium]|nr:hypothetical protein [Anaerolineae bacterium]